MARKVNTDLIAVCEAVLASKRRGEETTAINGVLFDDNLFTKKGRCQENARKVHLATTGLPQPGQSCCAGRTLRNLLHLSEAGGLAMVLNSAWVPEKLEPGDFLYFSGNPKCRCNIGVGHAAIWMGDGRMWQHTSRNRLAITDEPPTASQQSRFVAAFRLLPLQPADVPDWAAFGVHWAVAEGLLSHDDHGDFHGEQPVTRAMLAVVLQRFAQRE